MAGRAHLRRPGGASSRKSIEVRESTGVFLGDVPKRGMARCSLDSFLLLSSFFA